MNIQMILWLSIVGMVVVAFIFKACISLEYKKIITFGSETEYSRLLDEDDYEIDDDYEWQDYINM